MSLNMDVVCKETIMPPFVDCLNSDFVTKFRLAYQQFRLGVGGGTKNDFPELCFAKDLGDGSYHKQYESSGYKPGTNFTKDCLIDDWEDTSSSDVYQLMHDVTNFRIGYMNFRKGQSKGAHRDIGDLAKSLTLNHLLLLPIVQSTTFHQHLAGLVAEKIEPQKKDSQCHMHFGPGRLGFGLVFPALLKSSVPLVYVNTSFNSLANLYNGQDREIKIYVNNQYISSLTLMLPDDTVPPSADRILASTDSAAFQKLLNRATTFSTSVGPGIASISQILIQKGVCHDLYTRPVLYGCENDHNSLNILKETLVDYCDVIPCMVDRICTSFTMKPGMIEVSTEADPGNIVILSTGNSYIWNHPFCGSNVDTPSTKTESVYFSNRKVTIVNGMHTTMAFMTLCQSCQSDNAGNYPLMKPSSLSPDAKKELWAWIVARILMILWQHDSSIIMHAHNLKNDEEVVDMLIDYAKRTLSRFDSVDDTTSRVLSGGIENRWRTRLKCVDNLLMDTEVASIPNGKYLLSKSGLTEAFVLRVVRKLCEASYKYTKV